MSQRATSDALSPMAGPFKQHTRTFLWIANAFATNMLGELIADTSFETFSTSLVTSPSFSLLTAENLPPEEKYLPELCRTVNKTESISFALCSNSAMYTKSSKVKEFKCFGSINLIMKKGPLIW